MHKSLRTICAVWIVGLLLGGFGLSLACLHVHDAESAPLAEVTIGGLVSSHHVEDLHRGVHAEEEGSCELLDCTSCLDVVFPRFAAFTGGQIFDLPRPIIASVLFLLEDFAPRLLSRLILPVWRMATMARQRIVVMLN